MIITKKAIPRRTVLRGLGVSIALPLLDSMVPAATALAQTAAAPTSRFGFVYVPHGSIMRDWTPPQEGANFEFSPILKPLESFRKHVTVLSNLSNYGENGHSVSSAMWLSGTFPSKGSLLKLGTTVDQLIAQKIGRIGRRFSFIVIIIVRGRPRVLRLLDRGDRARLARREALAAVRLARAGRRPRRAPLAAAAARGEEAGEHTRELDPAEHPRSVATSRRTRAVICGGAWRSKSARRRPRSPWNPRTAAR
jgi:hypothetical protein